MFRKTWAYGLIAAASLACATPTLAQGIQIGPDGVRIVEPDRGPQRGDRRGGPAAREIGERDAVRIARSEGVREIDSVSRGRGSYRVVGIDRRGDDIQVDIDRRSGEVISVR